MRELYSIYLINLKRSKDRLAFMERQLKERGIENFVRIDAVDGRNLPPCSYIVKNRYKRKLAAGEIGGYLSHVKAMQQFLRSGDDFAVILEDDIRIEEDFKTAVEEAIDNYTTLPRKHRWDVLKLWNRNRRNIYVADVDNTYFIGACGTSIPGGALGAIWTKTGVRKFLDKTISKEGIPLIGRPVDCDFQHAWEYGLIIYNLLPSVVNTREMPSVIDESRTSVHSSLFGVVRYEMRRLVPKYRYYVKQHGFRKFAHSFILKKDKLVL